MPDEDIFFKQPVPNVKR